MDDAAKAWCREHLAHARNQLQILLGQHRFFIGDRDIADSVRERAESDVRELERITGQWEKPFSN